MARFAAISATLLTVLGGVAHAASADATGLVSTPALPTIQTQTVLSASSDTVATGGHVKITAMVTPGILATPTGSVTFTDTTTGRRLEKVQPGKRCLLIKDPCLMTITVRAAQLAKGANTIVATYSGDIVETPSSDSIIITRTDSTNPTVTTTCQPGSSQCVTPTDDSADGTAAASIATFSPTGQTETISVSFETAELPCSTPQTGDPLVFSSTNAPSEKVVTYTVLGTAADIANDAYGTAGNVCYGSPEKFVTKGFAPPVLEPDGDYYGLLPACSANVVVPPCTDPASFQPGSEGGEDEYTQNVIVTAEDPKMGH